MTQLNSIEISLPDSTHAVPHLGGVFDHFIRVKELEKALAALEKAANEQERQRYQAEVAGYLKRMSSTYYPELADLLSVCHSRVGILNDANLEKAIHVCEVAFHGHRANEQRPDFAVLLQIAMQALTFIKMLLRHRLARHEVPFSELHHRFFHFAHAALACLQRLGSKAAKGSREKVTSHIAMYLLLERLDLFSMNETRQRAVIRALIPITQECEVYFIPAGEKLDMAKGFWIDQEDKHSPGRSLLHGSLAGVSANDRLATNIFPLVRMLEETEDKAALGVQSGVHADIKSLVRKKIKSPKRREQRSELHESARLLVQWMDVVDMRPDRGINVALMEADDTGFCLLVDDRDAALPDVDSFIAVNRSGHGVKRGVLIWKRVEAKGVLLGGAWVEESFHQCLLSLLGHSEMALGVREWHALVRRLDERRIVCWIGEKELQPGISILLPLGGKRYSSTLERVDHRGGNYCRGVLVIGKEWKEIDYELDPGS